MAEVETSDADVVSTALDRLETPTTNNYVVAFGTNGRQFIATPNGYSATKLPAEVLAFLTFKSVKRVTWASYGSAPKSWFFVYELADGTSTFQFGRDIPAALRQFIDSLTPDLSSSLRVQLGNDSSFVAWARTCWACDGIPLVLENELADLSGSYRRTHIDLKSSLKAAIHQVAWHSDGSYYLEGKEGYFWHFTSLTTRKEWTKLWSKESVTPSIKELSELALVALDPHAPVGETFVFIKKQRNAQQATFIIHFYQDITHTSDTIEAAHTVQDNRMQHIPQEPEKPDFFRRAVSKGEGRPHASDSWELKLKRGQKVKVWKDKGNDWYIVETERGAKGYAHGSWLAFYGNRALKDPGGTYAQFQADMRALLIPNQLRVFPSLREYMLDCTNAACEQLKSTSQLGICVHDLQTLLEGSGRYRYEWLKEERIVWHPDKFARFCHADHREELKTYAQEMFVLYGVLMDMCRQQERK